MRLEFWLSLWNFGGVGVGGGRGNNDMMMTT